MLHVPPNILFWASSFFLASRLLPEPQLEHTSINLNLQTSQLIPHAPVGIFHLALLFLPDRM
jgi:hypothetical protein